MLLGAIAFVVIGFLMNKAKVYAEVAERYKEKEDALIDGTSIDEMCGYRKQVSSKLKELENERRLIDEYILEYFSEAELKIGITIRGGGIIKVRSRQNWKYPDALNEQVSVMRKQCRECGDAVCESSTYLVLTMA